MPTVDLEQANCCSAESNRSIQCPLIAQYAVLGLVSLHLIGVLSEPLRFFFRSDVQTAPEFAWLGETMKPYSQQMYLNHGYFFFAPNPGPSHLIECSIDGGNKFQLPDRNQHWPRLLYHRYFMLAEFYNSRYAPKQVSDEMKKDVEIMQRWSFDKELYDQLQSSIATSLQRSRNVDSLELRRVERLLPDANQVLRDGWTLNDARLTTVLPETMLESPPTSSADELPSKPDEPRLK
jgi:hypothetical protein